MTEERREQIRAMLLDIINNMDKPNDFEGSQEDFKRDWLFAVSDVASHEASHIKGVLT